MNILTEQGACNWIVEKDIEEGASGLPKGVILQARGKFAHAGRITSNGRLYTRKWYESQIERVSRKGGELESGAMLGEADHPSPTRGGPSVRQLAFIVRGLDMSESGEVMGHINVVNTGAGRDYAAGIRAGAQLGFSSRARGETVRKRMTDQHPDWDLNQDWSGKEFEEVEESAQLITFDAVIGPAIADAHVGDYNEQDEEVQDMDIKLEDVLKNEALMKGILESEAVKKKVEAAVEEAKKELEAGVEKRVAEIVQRYVESDEFAAKFEVAGDTDAGDKGDKTEAKCPECEALVPKGSKFCPECGRKVAAPPPKAESQDEKDKLIADLSKRMEAMEKAMGEKDAKIKEWEKRDQDAEEQAAVEKIVSQILESKAEAVEKRVRERLADKQLTEANAADVAKELAEKEEAYLKSIGAGELLEKGKGTNQPSDKDDSAKPKKSEVANKLAGIL